MAMTTGYAAAEMSITATAKIAYGNFGEEHKPGSTSKSVTNAEGGSLGTAAVAATGGVFQNNTSGTIDSIAAGGVKLYTPAEVAAGTPGAMTRVSGTDAVAKTDAATGAGYAYSDTFDVVVSGSGEAMGVAYSASMTIDEDAGSNSVGTLSMSTNGFTLAYGADDFGDLVADNSNGLEEAAGDIKLSYAANGVSASYEMSDTAESAYYMRGGYTNGALTVGLEVADTDGSGAGSSVNTISLAYTMGALTVSYDADDKATVANDNRGGSDYDAKVTYTMGTTVLSAGTDEAESHYAGLSTTIGGLSLTMRTEQDGKKVSGSATGAAAGTPMATAENELSLSYTMGALTVAYAKDTGDAGKFGDEAETLTTLTYNMGGITIVAKGNDQDETEVSAAFTF